MKLQFVFLHAICLVFSFNFLQLSIHANALGNHTDQLALLHFKQSINSDPFGILSSWNDSVSFCNWRGVTCGKLHHRVTALILEGHNLKGSISPHIGNLTFLRYINLQNNSFSGQIPQQVGRLFRLQHLTLTNNTFGGRIPVSLMNCSELRTIELVGNRLSGDIPQEIDTLIKLETFRVSINNLMGRIPTSLGNLSSLRRFFAQHNHLVGTIPVEVGRLSSINVFAAGVNQLSEYGIGGEASIEGDIYSFGVLILEIFTARRPTDQIFKDSFNLHTFVNTALPERLVEIVDPILLSMEAEETPPRRGNNRNIIESQHEINETDNLRLLNVKARSCLVSVLEIGLACSRESPKERASMNGVMRELHFTKCAFLRS